MTKACWDNTAVLRTSSIRVGTEARHLDESIKALGLSVLKSPLRCPKANAICERVIRTIRRECLDWLIPISETHPRSIVKMSIRQRRASADRKWGVS